MLLKIVSLIASFVLLFCETVPFPEASAEYMETIERMSEYRTADRIDGATGVRFFIQRPVCDKLTTVRASDFGLSQTNDDNTEAFQGALNYCKENPQTRLVIDKGTYYFRSSATLYIDDCTDLLIDGSDATFVFAKTGYKISVRRSDGVEIRNLNIDWAWDESPLASVVTVQNSDPDTDTIDLVFRDRGNCREDVYLSAITQCDKNTFTFGEKYSSKENYLYQDTSRIVSVKKIADDTLRIVHNGCLDSFSDGETYILRHFVYDGTVFHLTENSKNLTFDGVNIYGGTGMAFICEGNCSHFQIINSYIGVNPEYKDKRCVSLTADAIHIVNTDGCFNISGCDISSMGDDAVNVHDGLGYVSSVNGNTLTLIASAMRLFPGDTLAFKNEKFENTLIKAKIISVKHLEGITREVVFDGDFDGIISAGYVAYSTECDSSNYVIRDNYFHENRARALLLQSSNGLCENNRFYKIMGQAIKVVMDIEPTLWQEGTGVDNLIIRNNTFEKCNYSDWGTVIEIGTNIAGKSARTAVFTNIVISSNTFTDIPSFLLKGDNFNGLVFSGNTVNTGEFFDKNSNQGRIFLGNYSSNVTYTDNDFTASGFFREKEIVKAENVQVWAQVNSQL